MIFRNMMMAGLALAAAAASAQQGVIPEKSEIRFISTQMNVPVEGRFKRFTADVVFDPARLDRSRANISVDLDSIDLGNAEAETEVRRKGWFDTANSPRATFVSTGIKNAGPDTYEVAGKLTIKGVTKNVVVPITVRPAGNLTLAEGRFTVNRLAYRIGDGPWADVSIVADDVAVLVKIALGKL